MKARLVCWVGLVVWLLPGVTEAGRAPADLAREYLEVSGMKRRVEMVVPRVMAEFENSRGTLPSKRYAMVLSTFAKAYQPDKVYASIVAQVEDRFDEQEIREAIRFYRSPVGRKIVQANDEAYNTKFQQIARAYYEQAIQDPATPFRITLIRHIDDALGLSEETSEIGMLCARAVATALDTILEPDQRLGEAKIQQQMLIMRPQMQQSHQEDVVKELLYRYRDLTIDELRYYRRYLESEAGKHCTDTVRSAMTTALLQISQEISDDLSRLPASSGS